MMQNQQASDGKISSSCDATTVGARFAPEVQVRDEVCLLPESTFAGHLRRKRGRRGGCRRRSAHRVQELVSERETPAAREAGLYSPRSSSASESNLNPHHRDDESASKSRRSASSAEAVPRSLRDLLTRIISTIKTGGTRLAVYLRGWESLRAWVGGAERDLPNCKPCLGAAKNRGAKEVPPPNLGLFPCLPLPESGGSLEDRYVDFILGVSNFVAVGGNPMPLAAFRRPTSEAHVALIGHIKRQLQDFFEGCGGLDPLACLGSGRAGRLLADALERAGAAGPISCLHGSNGIATGKRVDDLQTCAIMPLVASRLAFPERAADWDLGEFLHGTVKEAYEDPFCLRVSDYPKLREGKICGSKQEFTKFASRR